MQRVGFERIDVKERFAFGLDRTAGYPLFTPDLIQLMYELIPPERHDRVASSIIVTAV